MINETYRPVLTQLELLLIYRALKSTIPTHDITTKIELYIHKINTNKLTPINQKQD